MLVQELKQTIPRSVLNSRLHFIINQKSAAGKTAKRWQKLLPKVRHYWGRNFTYSTTKHLWEIWDLVPYLLENDYHKIILMGGDGTVHHLLNAFYAFDETVIKKLNIGMLSSGTGQGLVMSLHLPADPEEQLRIIGRGHTQKVDLGFIEYVDFNGRLQKKLFVNECQIGLGGQVVLSLKPFFKIFGGRLAFGLTALKELCTVRPDTVDLILEESAKISATCLGLSIGNGSLTGGGMKLTPLAKPDDGVLDVLIIHDQSLRQRLQNLTQIYGGNHLSHSGFSYLQFKTLCVQSRSPLPVAADGEFLGFTPCKITVLPQLLNVFTK